MESSAIETIKNIFNIFFFLAMSVVAVLSYLQARKTLFSPIKTEIFKLQVEEIKKVLELFNRKRQADFDRECDISKVLEINARQMHISYINCFFKEKIETPKNLLEKLQSDCFGGVVSEKHVSKVFAVIKPGEELIKKGEIKTEKAEEPALKLAEWNEYEHGIVSFTEQYHLAIEEFAKLASSPLLPKELTEKIHCVISLYNKNLFLIGEVCTDAAKKMPTQYKTVEQTINFNPSWVWNEYNSRRASTEESVVEILNYINKHLKIDLIMK